MPVLLDPNASAPRPSVSLDTALASDAPSDEAQAIALAKNPPAKSQRASSLWTLVSLVAFVVLGSGARSAQELALFVAVLFLHEGGHVAGMRWFAYHDVQMFFVPFFGALTRGAKKGAPGWQQAIVLLLGPLPGLALSAPLLAVSEPGIWRALAVQLLWVNGFNLFPLYPLDGGRFVQLLFSTRPRLQAAFSRIGLLALGALSWRFGNWLVVAVAVLLLPAVSLQLVVGKAAVVLRTAWKEVPPFTELSDAALHDLFVRARGATPVKSPKPDFLASLMRQIHDRAASEPVPFSAGVALVGAYMSGFTFLLIDLLILAFR
jgi:Zn-dependent protease